MKSSATAICLLILVSMTSGTPPPALLEPMGASPGALSRSDASEPMSRQATDADADVARGLGSGATYYVSPAGSDQNDGLTRSSPFETIQQAADIMNPGDAVLIMAGTYTAANAAVDVVRITRSGRPGRWITFKNDPGSRPVIFNERSWQGINIAGASYIIIEGLEIKGNNQAITEAVAAAADAYHSPTNGNCIMVHESDDRLPHHILIRDNVVHHCPGGGIGTLYADYITIDGNTVFNTSWWSKWGNSGISIYESRDLDNYPGYRNFVINNVLCGNAQRMVRPGDPAVTDGNGIIIDDLSNTQSDGAPYTGRTLVANNVSFRNGGRGIHVYSSRHVDVINNTTYGNSTILDDGAEIAVVFAEDVRVINNVAYARTGTFALYGYGNAGEIRAHSNLLHNVRVGVGGVDELSEDPLFIDELRGDFRLRPGSPGIDSGHAEVATGKDIAGVVRPQGSGPDRGAYEAVASPAEAAPVDIAPCAPDGRGSR